MAGKWITNKARAIRYKKPKTFDLTRAIFIANWRNKLETNNLSLHT